MAAKTVKVSTTADVFSQYGIGEPARERRMPLHDVKPDGTDGYAVLCNVNETPHARAGVARNWKRDGLPCGPSDRQQQWWIAV